MSEAFPYPDYQDHLSYITDEDAKQAFVHFVDVSSRLERFAIRPKPHGSVKRNLHYFPESGGSQFSFIVARNWILFKIRKPWITHKGLTLVQLSEHFESAVETQAGEFSFKIRTVDEANRALAFAFNADSSSPPPSDFSAPGEIHEKVDFLEGAVAIVQVNSYERNAAARQACIAHYGCACVACGFDFFEFYGDLGAGFIHVHHLKELSSIKAEYKVDPIEDLRPLCPN